MKEEPTRSDIPGISWPPVRVGKNAVLSALLGELEKTQWMSSEKIEELQMRQFANLVNHHLKNTPSFVKRIAKARLGGKIASTKNGLKRIPVLTRRDIQDAGKSFFCLQVPREHQPVSVTKTSGSTGEPVVISKTAINLAFWSVNTLRDHIWHDRDMSGKLAAIRAVFKEPTELRDWGSPVADLYHSGSTQCIPIMTDVRKQMRMLEKFKPNLILTHPSTIQAYCDLWEEYGFGLGRLKHIRSIGETVSDDLRQSVKELTGLPIEDLYSSQEVGIIALQCPDSDLYHVMAESLIVEVLNGNNTACAEGEVGRVVVTDLHNFASPIIRYEIGDFAEVAGTCACGRGLPTLRRINGRERHLIKYPDGKRSWPKWGNKQISEIANIRQIQLVQEKLDALELRLVTDVELAGEQEQAIVKIVRKKLEYPFKVRITQSRERLELSSSGKFEQFYCKI